MVYIFQHGEVLVNFLSLEGVLTGRGEGTTYIMKVMKGRWMSPDEMKTRRCFSMLKEIIC